LDIVTVQDVGLRTLDDPAVLEWAAGEGRILLTHDLATMKDFAYQRVAAGLPMPGVFEIPVGTPRSVIIDELLLIDAASDPDDWAGVVHYLPLG
jgi:predicted nuclease of predicted toxin-antitoxin system